MLDFLNTIINGDLQELLGDLYTPTAAGVAAALACIAFGAVAQAFSYVFLAIFNMGGRK